ncbi:MAG TPA: CbiX/SirB N-terminal domain-containing protein [Nocardioidaceae bacterium]|nr:CbiX/SirB N-terminal domain-containing protein [Nocardioidaceae bacterium]
MPTPRVVMVAHGTRRHEGNKFARRLTERAVTLLDVPAKAAFVELADPLVADVMAGLPPDHGAVAVVPLLLSTGCHVRRDLPVACAGAPRAIDVTVGQPLGPEPALARALSDRLDEAGARPGQPVVLIAAGSTDPRAEVDLAEAADHLAAEREVEVRVATLGGRGRRPAEVVRPGDAVAPYLLSTGLFSRRCDEEARNSGATIVGDVLGTHDGVVDLVVARARALLASGTID